MADIHVQPDNRRLILNFHFFSPQHFSYTITLINRERNEQLYRDRGDSDGKTSFDLGEADDLIGLYLIIDWTVIDPAGAGSAISAAGIVDQQGVECVAHQRCAGVSNDTAVFLVTIGKFVINSL
jgi:hypothetical protein